MSTGAKLGRAAAFLVLAIGLSNLLVNERFDGAFLAQLREAVAAAAAAVLAAAGLETRVEAAFIHMPHGAVEIVDSCTGLDVFVILASAMLVFPARWRARGVGILLAGAVVFAANFLRVLVLCWFVGSDGGWFDSLHGYVWPLLMIAASLAVSLFWMQNIAQPRDPSAPT